LIQLENYQVLTISVEALPSADHCVRFTEIKMKKLILIICVFCAVIGCMKTQTTDLNVSGCKGFGFIDAFLSARFPGNVSQSMPLIIEEQLSINTLINYNRFDSKSTISELKSDLSQSAKIYSKDLVEAVKDFCDKNSGYNTVDALGNIECAHEIITKDDYDEIFLNNVTFPDNPWVRFYAKHPDSPGIITLSKPGFSSDGDVGVIYMENIRETMVGLAKLYVMEKKNGKWTDVNIKIGTVFNY
jgi:hypothetical protein